MESRMSRAVARAAWILPVALFALSVQQFKATRDLGTTLREGVPGQAEVTRYFRSDRKDVTHAEVDLRLILEDGTQRTWEHLALPYSIAHRLDEKDSVAVRFLAGGAQEVVIEEIAGTQRSIALSNAAMSLVVFLIALALVWGWNRYIGRLPAPEEAASGQSA